jgi:hypothetical protein
MLTSGFKLFMGYALGALLAAAVYGYTTGGSHLGPLSVGWKGAVGEHIGYAVLLITGAVAGAHSLILIAFRDADARAAAELLGVETASAQRPTGQSYWPIIAAFGMGAVALGLVLSPAVFVAGVVALVIVTFEWTMSAWADRATGDPEVNRELRDRIMQPIEVPVGAVLAIIVVPLAASRVFLSVTKFSAVWVATGVAAVVFITAIVLATRPKLSKNVVAGIVLIGGLAFLTGGIVAAAVGTRDIEHHETEHSVDEEHGGDSGQPGDSGGEVGGETSPEEGSGG